MNRAVKFLREAKTFYLATIDGDSARVRPFGAVVEFEGRTYLCTNSEKAVYQQMIRNPHIEISATNQDGDWIRISGKAVVDSRQQAKEAMLATYPNIRSLYTGKENLFQVLYLDNATATIYSFSKEPDRFQI